jgi:16S rRNA (uracil1498-N3)-methyltransferase
VSRPRLHIPAERWDRRVRLREPERRHLVAVLRLGSGDRLEVFDGEGHVCQAELNRAGKSWLLSLGPRESRPDKIPRVSLGVALLKGRKLDSVVRMVTEVGVASIQLFTCARSVPRPDARRMRERIRRLGSIASEGARQSCRSSVPTLEPVQSLEKLLLGDLPPFCALLHTTAGDRTLSDLLADAGPERLLLVGPEGGFTPGEIEAARRTGFYIAGLGLPVLRAETAAVVAAAVACLP